MTHVCTWRHCGAPATKMVRVRLRYPERIVDTKGRPIASAKDSRELWRCDPHYEEERGRWSRSEDLFIVEW